MQFKTIKEVEEKFNKYEDLSEIDKLKNISYWTEHKKFPKMGDWMLFKHVQNHDDGKESEISKPILGLIIGHTIWDQALVLEYVTEWRGYEINSEVLINDCYWSISINDKEVKHIQFWSDNIIVLEQWKNKPTFRELRKAFKEYERI